MIRRAFLLLLFAALALPCGLQAQDIPVRMMDTAAFTSTHGADFSAARRMADTQDFSAARRMADMQDFSAATHAADTIPVAASPGVGTKLLWLGAASVAFAGFDYVGFNLTRNSPGWLKVYRVGQVLAQGAITYLLYDRLGLSTAVSFNVLWWTFCCDFLYYGYAELINPGHPWESRGDLRGGVFQNDATWAYWTPLGIMRGMKRQKGLPGESLVGQALFGLTLGVSVTIAF